MILWLILIFCIVLFVFLTIYFYYIVKTGLLSVSYIPTSSRDLEPVLLYAKLKKGMQFVDLGCGDGRLVIAAVKKYGVYGIGLEINPLLILFARIWAKFLKLKRATFLRQDLYTFSLHKADVVYLFLFPRMMEKMSAKIKKECKEGTLIISRGFELPGFKQVDMIATKTFETFIYRV